MTPDMQNLFSILFWGDITVLMLLSANNDKFSVSGMQDVFFLLKNFISSGNSAEKLNIS